MISPALRERFATAAALESQGRFAEAETCCRQIVAEAPHFHPAWHALGLLLFRAGNLPEAVNCLESAIAGDGQVALYHSNLGELYRRQGQPEQAVAAGLEATRLAPGQRDAHYNLGLAYGDAGAHEQAAASYRKALEIAPDHALSWNNLGATLERLGDQDAALAAYEKAAALDPRHAIARNNLGVLYLEKKQSGAAHQALAAANGEYHQQGIEHYRAGRFAAAMECYERALAIQAEQPAVLNSKGFLLQDLGFLDEAQACFAQAVDLAPDMAMPRLNLGMLQLKRGDWAAGWENYEARWTGSAEAANGTLNCPDSPLPQWTGQGETAGKRLLLISEQGFGDVMQFSRYLPLATERFAKVGFACAPPLQRLLEWSFGDRVAFFTRLPADNDAWDWQYPLLSLPRAFGTRPDTVPRTVPYLRILPPAQDYWRERLERAAPGRPRIGIAWAGRKAHQADARRSLKFERLRPLLENRNVTWVSLQKWAPEDERPAIPDGVDWLDWTDELNDFADSAALAANLDLVITIDSAVVHLAGALNRPVWMLNRFDGEWRWLHRRADSPWYPSLRIFNQSSFGDWDGVLADVSQALAARFPA